LTIGTLVLLDPVSVPLGFLGALLAFLTPFVTLSAVCFPALSVSRARSRSRALSNCVLKISPCRASLNR
jgi:uncharacterized membrane protein YkgB